MAGTPCYMAPEMIGGHDARISERTDVYLLGAILHELATGKVPHEGDTLMAILVSVAKSEPALHDGVPAELGRIIRRAMDPDPDARFETAEQFRLAIGGFLEHRGSIRLATEAEERLERLLEERDKVGVDEAEKRLALYHYFGECRFGFLEALRTWKGNEAAQKGLRRAIEAMIAFELGANDARAASVLLAELKDPPAELSVRVSEALAKANVEREAAQKLAREHDDSIGRRTRAFLAGIMGSLWTIGPFVWQWLWPRWDFARSHWAAIDFAFVTAILGQGLYWWARDSMSKTVMNRKLVWTVRLTVITQIVLLLGAYAAGIAVEQANVLMIFLWGTITATVATNIEPRLAPAAIVTGIAFLVACVRLEWTFYCMAVSNGGLLVNMIAVWGRLSDDLGEVRRRAEERHQRWASFLEKSRMPMTTEPPPAGEESGDQPGMSR
jgi:serine/threonine-protein kinase